MLNGKQWNSSLAVNAGVGLQHADLTYDKICELTASNEDQAEHFFQRCKEDYLPASISQAVEKGAEYVMMSAPFSIIDSKAYENFKEWAANHALSVRVFGIEKDVLSSGEEDFLILSVTPEI